MSLRYHLEPLGCEKNLVEAERLAGLLEWAGWREAPPEEADWIFVLTCGFLQEAREESLEVLRALQELPGRLAAYGCMVRLFGEQIRRELGEVTLLRDLTDVQRLLWGRPMPVDFPRKRLREVPFAYLRIAEGCSRNCAFCIIPRIKGPHRSEPAERLLREAKALVEQGALEVNVVAQDTTFYGIDSGGPSFAELLERLAEESGARWIRVFYLFPTAVTDALLQVFRHPAVLPYFDIPVQHVHPAVLRAMRRPGDGAQYQELFLRIREHFPEAYLRTNLLVGHPGETREAVDALLRWIEETPVDAIAVFPYSPETQPLTISEEERAARVAEVSRMAQDWMERRFRERVGRSVEVLILDAEKGRSWFQAEGVDGYTFLPTKKKGIVRAQITDCLFPDFLATLETDAAVGLSVS